MREWSADKEAFESARQLQVFKYYPIWKYFKGWRKQATCQRMERVGSKLSRELLILQPSLYELLAHLHATLCNLVAQSSTPHLSEEVYDMESLTKIQNCQVRLIHDNLWKVYQGAAKSLFHFSRKRLEEQGLHDSEKNWNKFLRPQRVEGWRNSQSPKIHKDKEGELVSWSYAALQRRECQILSFIFRLVDIMFKSATRNIAVEFAEQQFFAMYKGLYPSRRRYRHTCPPAQSLCPTSLMVDVATLTDTLQVGLASKNLNDDIYRWRVSFRVTVDQTGSNFRKIQRSAHLFRPRFNSPLRLQENCLSISFAVRLVQGLIPGILVLDKYKSDDDERTLDDIVCDAIQGK